MHHHHARVLERRLVDKIVMRIVADLVEREIEVLRVKLTSGLVESFDMRPGGRADPSKACE